MHTAPSSHTHHTARDNLRGAGLMVLAMVFFTMEDALIKSNAPYVPLGQIFLVFGLGGLAVYALITVRRGESLFPRAARSKVMVARLAFEALGRGFFTLAFVFGSLAASSAILQATPIVVTAIGALIWRERVGATRWGLILLGFVGVLMVIRPGPETFSTHSLFAVIGMLGLAGRDLATRAAPMTLSFAQLGFYGFLGLLPTAAFLMLWSGPFVTPAPLQIGALVMIIAVGVTAYTCLTFAMRAGALSVVTPFRYSRLPMGVAMAMIAFGEQPDRWEIFGGVVIVLAGLGIMLTARR